MIIDNNHFGYKTSRQKLIQATSFVPEPLQEKQVKNTRGQILRQRARWCVAMVTAREIVTDDRWALAAAVSRRTRIKTSGFCPNIQHYVVPFCSAAVTPTMVPPIWYHQHHVNTNTTNAVPSLPPCLYSSCIALKQDTRNSQDWSVHIAAPISVLCVLK